jgi:hypothetical protein
MVSTVIAVLVLVGYLAGGVWGVRRTWQLIHAHTSTEQIARARREWGPTLIPTMLGYAFLLWWTLPLIERLALRDD